MTDEFLLLSVHVRRCFSIYSKKFLTVLSHSDNTMQTNASSFIKILVSLNQTGMDVTKAETKSQAAGEEHGVAVVKSGSSRNADVHAVCPEAHVQCVLSSVSSVYYVKREFFSWKTQTCRYRLSDGLVLMCRYHPIHFVFSLSYLVLVVLSDAMSSFITLAIGNKDCHRAYSLTLVSYATVHSLCLIPSETLHHKISFFLVQRLHSFVLRRAKVRHRLISNTDRETKLSF